MLTTNALLSLVPSTGSEFLGARARWDTCISSCSCFRVTSTGLTAAVATAATFGQAEVAHMASATCRPD